MQRAWFVSAALIFVLACGGSAPEPAAASHDDRGDHSGHDHGSAAVETDRTLPIPGSSGSATSQPQGARSLPLVWDKPESWEQVPPANSMRLAQYRVPGSGGDGELTVFYFGAGQGGDIIGNAQRWANQFTQPDGSNPIDAMTIEPVEAEREVQLVTTTGTYNGGMTMGTAPAEPKPDWMLLGGIVMGPDAPWFFKLTGPEPTLREQREAFLTLLRSARPATQ